MILFVGSMNFSKKLRGKKGISNTYQYGQFESVESSKDGLEHKAKVKY